MSCYLGLDLSTQKLKAAVINGNLEIIEESEVHFDSQMPEFRTQAGVLRGDQGEVTSPVLMWIKALDLLLTQLQASGLDFSSIKGLSGTAQQHGSVFWHKGASKTLDSLDSSKFLHEQLSASFSLINSPVWMDSSTTKYCKLLEDVVGGPEEMAQLTGSRAYERFTGVQIAKVAAEKSTAYAATERISLISSFLATLFLGKYAQIDFADGSGMNLMNIRLKTWDKQLLTAAGGFNLDEKLGKLSPPLSTLGPICNYFVERFGFSSSCQVIIFTGDNPASFAGLCLRERDVAVSLGTSDTVMFSLPEPRLFLNGHVLASPLHKENYLAMLCFKNGSLTRERIKGPVDWETFGQRLDTTPRGNFGNMGLYFDDREILPFVAAGDYRWNAHGVKVSKFPSEEIEARALIEGQFLARRVYSEDLGLKLGQEGRIIATGGASSNQSVLQVLSDVFNMPVYVQESANSAVLGSAYIALLATTPEISYEELIKRVPQPILVCEPYQDASKIYDSMALKYRTLL